MNKEVNQRASVIEEWINNDGKDTEVLCAFMLALASIMTQTNGDEEGKKRKARCYRLIEILVGTLE